MYRELDATLIIATADRLTRRIDERFPDSGLGRVSQELLAVARESEARAARLRRPNWPLRALAAGALVFLLAVIVAGGFAIRVRSDVGGWFDFVQGVEAAINDIVLVGLGVFFLFTIETRLKRRTALRALHQLRSIAHIVDMHQLTKDPDVVLTPEMATASSPERRMTRFQLARYLDYCSELLALTSKVAALYAQCLDDPVVLDAVSGVQGLTYGLSGKIWQKIMILDTIAAQGGPAS